MKDNEFQISAEAIRKRIKVPKHPVWPTLTDDEKEALKGRIKKLLKEQNAAAAPISVDWLQAPQVHQHFLWMLMRIRIRSHKRE